MSFCDPWTEDMLKEIEEIDFEAADEMMQEGQIVIKGYGALPLVHVDKSI